MFDGWRRVWHISAPLNNQVGQAQLFNQYADVSKYWSPCFNRVTWFALWTVKEAAARTPVRVAALRRLLEGRS